jgi:dUTP pyrophosphatase
MDIKFIMLDERAIAPSQANKGDAGFDLYAHSVFYPPGSPDLYVEIGTGTSFEIPKNYVGLLFPRSSISNTRHSLRNSVGVIDSGYRGEIKFRFSPDLSKTSYSIGDKVGQIVFLKLPSVSLIQSKQLSTSSRGSSGFGSSGK